MRETYSIMGALCGTTQTFLSTDTSQLLTTAYNAAANPDVDFSTVKSALISVETNSVRISFGVTATTSLGHIVISGGSIRLPDPSFIRSARIISASAGSHGRLQVTLEY